MKRTWKLTLDTDRSEIIDQVNKSLNLLTLRVVAPRTELRVSVPAVPKPTKKDMERFAKWRKKTQSSNDVKTPVKKTKRSGRKKVS